MKTKLINIGNIKIGGGEPVAVQSMTNTVTADVKSTLAQIAALRGAGCALVRVAVKDAEDATAIYEIKKAVGDYPIAADIHFDYRLAVAAAESGADKIRVNPGNIRGNIKEIAAVCRRRKIPVRIGVNGGSLSSTATGKSGAEKLVASAAEYIKAFNELDFDDLVVSVKSSSVTETIAAYRLLRKKTRYPLHIGVTEAGAGLSGIIKSAVGIGSLLADGIGDTVRVSLSGDPVKEIDAARRILRAAGRGGAYVEVVACPTCGRTGFDVEGTAVKIEEFAAGLPAPARKIKVAVMGCVVNGPGEAADADIGIAGGHGKSALFTDGKIVKTVDNAEILNELKKELTERINGKK